MTAAELQALLVDAGLPGVEVHAKDWPLMPAVLRWGGRAVEIWPHPDDVVRERIGAFIAVIRADLAALGLPGAEQARRHVAALKALGLNPDAIDMVERAERLAEKARQWDEYQAQLRRATSRVGPGRQSSSSIGATEWATRTCRGRWVARSR